MTTNKFDPFDDENDDLDFVEFNLNKIKEKIPSFSSEKLCEMIVCDRYFGCYKEMSEACMEELAARRLKGDTFKFETYITDSMKELPVLDFSLPDLGSVLRTLIAQKGGK
jgi:hypothetical protein